MAEYIPSTEDFGLNEIHFTWAGTYVLEAATFLYPDVNFILADADCVPTSLFEVSELPSCTTHTPAGASTSEQRPRKSS